MGAVGLHVSHPVELSLEFLAATKRLQEVVPIMFANIPLLHGVNDDVPTMRALLMKLYRIGIVPHYLYHFMPYSPGSTAFKTSIKKGIEIINALNRRISGLAMPKFVIPHQTGKYTVPLSLLEKEGPHWGIDLNNNPVLKFKNWKGCSVEYPDLVESN